MRTERSPRANPSRGANSARNCAGRCARIYLAERNREVVYGNGSAPTRLLFRMETTKGGPTPNPLLNANHALMAANDRHRTFRQVSLLNLGHLPYAVDDLCCARGLGLSFSSEDFMQGPVWWRPSPDCRK